MDNNFTGVFQVIYGDYDTAEDILEKIQILTPDDPDYIEFEP